MNDPVRVALPVQIQGPGIMAIARRLSFDAAPSVAKALAAAGIGAMELTLNEPEDVALAAIEAVVRRSETEELLVGAGTVLSVEAAARAVEAGAAFLVMPHVDVEIIRWAAQRKIPAFPGAATPTEVLAGWRAGAAAVKVFPASSLGPAFIRELRGPLPDIPLLPTGGVTADNARAFIAAGAVALGVGGWLTADTTPARIAERAARMLAEIDAARKATPGG